MLLLLLAIGIGFVSNKYLNFNNLQYQQNMWRSSITCTLIMKE